MEAEIEQLARDACVDLVVALDQKVAARYPNFEYREVIRTRDMVPPLSHKNVCTAAGDPTDIRMRSMIYIRNTTAHRWKDVQRNADNPLSVLTRSQRWRPSWP